MCDCRSASEAPPDTRPANALCPGRPPPRVAVCIVGGVRTFPQPQAWRSLKRNLVEAFGGHGLAATTPDVFMDLKLVDDAPKTQREWRFDAINQQRNLNAVCNAACAFQPVSLVLRNESHVGPKQPMALAHGCFRSGFFGHSENLMRAVSQWSSFASCHARIASHEAANGGREYDVVALTRPDTVWYTSLRPFCLHDVRERTVIHRGPLRWNSTLEWLLLLPRKHAATVLTTADLFDECRPKQPCCSVSRSEDLLALALARAGRWHREPFGVDILRASQHAKMRNAGCMQPETMGFSSFDHCRAIIYGPSAATAAGFGAPGAGAGAVGGGTSSPSSIPGHAHRVPPPYHQPVRTGHKASSTPPHHTVHHAAPIRRSTARPGTKPSASKAMRSIPLARGKVSL
jgi:hypothetical protein